MDFPLPSWPSQVSLKGMIITNAGDLSVEQVPQMHLGVCQNFKPEGPQDTTGLSLFLSMHLPSGKHTKNY